MPFQKGQSGNPAGRPIGARGKATLLAEEIFAGEIEAIIRVVIDKAKDGDMAAARLCLGHIVSQPKGRAVPFVLPPLDNASSVLTALADIAAAVTSGDLTPAEAGELSRLAERHANLLRDAPVPFDQMQKWIEERLRMNAPDAPLEA